MEQTLRAYRETLGWSQDELRIMIGRAGYQDLNGESAISRLTISHAENGRDISEKSARAIAMGLNLGYEQRRWEKRFSAEDILELVRKAAQERAKKKRRRAKDPEDQESEKEEEGRFAIAG